MSALDVVAEGEECIAAQRHAAVLCYPLLLLFACQRFRLLLEEHLPCTLAKNVVIVVADVNINSIVAVGAADVVNKRQRHHLRMLAQPPDVSLVARETSAMDAALLTSADAYRLSVLHVAYRVALRIFQCYQRYDEVATRLLAECLVLCGDVLEESGVVQTYLVASLFKGDAEALLRLHRCRNIVRVYLYHVISALALLTQYLQRLLGKVGSNHAVAHLTLQQRSHSSVAGVAQRNEVAIRTHAVGTAGTGIGTCYRREFHLHVVHEVNLLQRVAQGQTYCSASRRHMLERCCCGQTCGSLQFLHQLPRVQRVKEIDVARTAVKDFDG